MTETIDSALTIDNTSNVEGDLAADGPTKADGASTSETVELSGRELLAAFGPEMYRPGPLATNGSARRRDSTREQASRPTVSDVAASDDEGRITLTEAQRRRWGIEPGVELRVEETPEGLTVRRADPALARLYIEPTSNCNLNCRTCVRHSWDEPGGTLSLDAYRRLIAGLAEVPTLRTVAFWGFGEPLLHPDIVEMVALASALGARTEIVTNGLLLDERMSLGLIEAGLDRLVVSVDGTTPEANAEIRSGGDLGLVVENIRRFNVLKTDIAFQNCGGTDPGEGDRQPEIGIEFVLMRRNMHELPKLRQLARQLEAKSIVLTNVLPYTRELADEVLYGFPAGRAYRRASPLAPEVQLPWIDTRGGVAEPLIGLLESVGSTAPLARRSAGKAGYCRWVNEGSAFVAYDGGVSPCAALLHSYTCFVMGREKRIRRFSVGDVASQPIADIWATEELRRFRRRVVDFEFSPCSDCGSCELSESNEADCIGNPFPVCGDCLWAKGVIQCP